MSQHRQFEGGKLVIASHNPGKVREIGELLAPFGADVVSAGDLGLPEPVEDGLTFAANAEIKARAAVEGSGLPALADDSGIEVSGLGGEPGIYSARWAGPDKDFDLAMQAIEEKLGDSPDRNANFACALTLCWPDGHVETVQGRVDGTLIWPPRGDKGFGYDPVFRANGMDMTFAEIDPAQKHAISHRADAFKQLVARCFAGS